MLESWTHSRLSHKGLQIIALSLLVVINGKGIGIEASSGLYHASFRTCVVGI